MMGMVCNKIILLVTYWFTDRPVRELGGVTEMFEIVDIDKEFLLELWVVDDGDGTVLVEGAIVAA